MAILCVRNAGIVAFSLGDAREGSFHQPRRENFSILGPGVMSSIRKKVLAAFENFWDSWGNRTMMTQEILGNVC